MLEIAILRHTHTCHNSVRPALAMDSPYLARSRWLAANVLPHEPAVRAWLHCSTHASATDIDDIIQETYAILARLESVESIRDAKAYARQVAKSVFLQGLRRSKIIPIDAIADLEGLQVADDVPSPEQHAIGKRELRRVEVAIESMPAQVRKTFWLRRVEGLSQRDTAQRLGLAEHTIEKYMARGVKLLLKQFGHGGNLPAKSSKVRDLELVGAEPPNAGSETCC